MVRTFNSALLKHAYWELRVEAHVDPQVWKTAQRVARYNFHSNDLLLREVLSDTIFSFATNKRLFNSLLLLNRLRNWQRLLRTMSRRSKWELADEDQSEYLQLAFEAAMSILGEPETSPYWQADPTGERALYVAGVLRKNLNLLWLDGKLPEREAEGVLAEVRQRLRTGITDPDRLLDLLAGS
jgi:hypothetical protein